MALQDTFQPVFDPAMQAVCDWFEAYERQRKLGIGRHRKMLKRLLAQRFGELSPQGIAYINKASARKLDQLALRLLLTMPLDKLLDWEYPTD